MFLSRRFYIALFYIAASGTGLHAADETRVITDFNIPGEWQVSKWAKAEGRVAVRPEVPVELKKAEPPVTESLGIKIDWPGGEGFRIFPIVPGQNIRIPFKVKEFRLWINGSGTEHLGEIIFDDADGQRQKIGLGKLNFQGWKELKLKVPPTMSQPLTITTITFNDWGVPTPGETTIYLSHLEAVIDPSAKLDGSVPKSKTNDNW